MVEIQLQELERASGVMGSSSSLPGRGEGSTGQAKQGPARRLLMCGPVSEAPGTLTTLPCLPPLLFLISL